MKRSSSDNSTLISAVFTHASKRTLWTFLLAILGLFKKNNNNRKTDCAAYRLLGLHQPLSELVKVNTAVHMAARKQKNLPLYSLLHYGQNNKFNKID